MKHLSLCVVLFGIVLTNESLAENARVSATLIDPKGQTTRSELSSTFTWSFEEGENPSLILKIDAPSGYVFQSASATGGAVKASNSESVTFQIKTANPSLNAVVALRSAPQQPLNMLVDFKKGDIKEWIDRDCARAYVGLRRKMGQVPPEGLALGIQCSLDATGASMAGKFVLSEDMSTPDRNFEVHEAIYPGATSSLPPSEDNVIKTVKIRKGSQATDYELFLRPPRPKFYVEVPLGPSLLYYTESPATITTTDIGVAGGLNSRFQIGNFGIDAGGIVSFLQLVHSSTDTNRAVWIDAHADALFDSKIKLFGMGVTFLAGGSLLHMIVPSNVYGVSATLGPEVGIELHKRHHIFSDKWNIHAKFGLFGFSAISPSGTIGGSYRINSKFSKLPLSITGDVRFASLRSATVANTALGIFAFLGVKAHLFGI